jgi:phasin family protein
MATTQFNESAAPSAAKAQAVFGDFNARAKAALEKSAKFGEELTDLAKGNVEALVQSSKAATKGAESLAEHAAEYGKKHLERTTSALSGFAAAKSPAEFFQLQSDFARASIDDAIAGASRFSEAWLKLASEVVQPLSSRYAVAAEKIKNAAL